MVRGEAEEGGEGGEGEAGEEGPAGVGAEGLTEDEDAKANEEGTEDSELDQRTEGWGEGGGDEEGGQEGEQIGGEVDQEVLEEEPGDFEEGSEHDGYLGWRRFWFLYMRYGALGLGGKVVEVPITGRSVTFL